MLMEGRRSGDFIARFHPEALATAVLLFLAPWPTNGQPLPGADPQGKSAAVPSAPAALGKDIQPAVTASKENPFVNTLGMKFVPVPIPGGPSRRQPVLFSVWDTRVQDYAA